MKRMLLFVSLCMACALFTGVAVAQSPFVLEGDITLEEAQAVIDAAKNKAKAQGTLMNIAVVDAGGNLKAFSRMDGAFLGSIDIATRKARTARYFNMSTSELGAAAQPGQPLFGIEATNDGLVIFGGGELLKNASGVIIGAVGVSGSSVENDVDVAKAGTAALGASKKSK